MLPAERKRHLIGTGVWPRVRNGDVAVRSIPRLVTRGLSGYLAALTGTALITILLSFAKAHLNLHVRVFPVVYLVLILLVASGWGSGPAIFATIATSLALDYFFLPPEYTWVTTPEHWVLLAAFASTGLLASQLAGRARRRAVEAESARVGMAQLYEKAKEQARALQLQARLLEVTHDAIIVRDSEARIRFWNRGAERKYGWSSEEAMGRVTHELLQTDFPQPRKEIEETVQSKGFWEGELTHSRKDGKRIVVESRWVLAPSEDQSPAILETNKDISRRKLAEQELLKAKVELEGRVRKRAADLVEANLLLQQEIAERRRAEADLAERSEALAYANTDLEQVSYLAAHDLQEPLRMIVGYLALLDRNCRSLLDAKGREYLDFAVDGGRRMQILTDDLLAYSRVGKLGHESAPTDATAALGWATANLKTAIEESGARITFDPLPVVPADATQLTQLFQNLISNAIKFRRDQVPEVHISAEHLRDRWKFGVKDNGIGMESRDLDQIFKIFHRLHRSQRYPGSGMGLAICRKIVERHGGKIWAESVPGFGSTFFFTLPDHGRESDGDSHAMRELAVP